MRKNPNLISDEELLKLLEESEDSDTPEISFDGSVIAFVQTFNLKPGKDLIVKKQLYKLYQIWNKSIQKLSQTAFTNELSHYLEHKGNFYRLDKNLFQIANFIELEKKKHTQDKSKSRHWQKHFTSFLESTNISDGTCYIELEILYYIYSKWIYKTKKRSKLSRRQFIKILDLYFDVKAIGIGAHLWVGVNEEIKNLITKSEIQLWRKTRAKDKKRFFYPKEEWKKFALYWEEKKEE